MTVRVRPSPTQISKSLIIYVCISVLYPHQFMYEYVLIYSSAENHYYKSQQYGDELYMYHCIMDRITHNAT